ncbi:histidine kinase [Polaribacter sp. ALD11]|uniref:tetratricopeptide repeat-containing sensor histidine kinase n=1 Tax=Polaribacter sp. ALD11 TaxID=2058137 RepID=UPI000C306641|nr:tetratricopeptide repeat-containing sensor histidine kinase [Polaribacter sp. ALD11]AUC86262.1 histidine kinase [Polaribacter sp. ALD11]
MRKRIQTLFYIFFISFNSYQLKAAPNNRYGTEEVSVKEISSVFTFKTDSVFTRRYDKVLNEYNKENYLDALQDALKIYDDSKIDNIKCNTYKIISLIADIYDKVNNHERALDYYKESLRILKYNIVSDNINDEFLLKNSAKIYLRMGSTFQKLLKRDSAKYYFEKIDDLPSVNNEVIIYKAASYSNLAGIYELDSLFDKAIVYAEKAIVLHKITNNKISEAKATMNLGNIYLSLDNFSKSKKTYLKGIKLIKNDNSQTAVRLKADLYYNLAWAMRNLKEYEAYDNLELSYEIEDGIRDKEVRRMVEEVTAKFDVEGVKKEEENKRLRQNATFWIFIIAGAIIIITLLYWLSLNRLKQKNLGLKLSQTQLLQNQNIEKLKSESQTRILNATIDGKETERKEIAETLHDSVSALLSSANLHLMATKTQFKGEIPVEIDKTQSIIAEASQKIRDLSHTLVSSVLLKFGLNFALKDMASKYSNSVLYIETDIYDLRRYHQNFEIKIYNIIQEFVNNILKHSKAENAVIKLYEQDNRICFQITDDGIGFDKTKVFNKDGLGLNQIDARIQMMQGLFLVESTIGEGTTVSVELPVIEKNAINHGQPIL